MAIVSDETARDWLLKQSSPEAVDQALFRSLTSTCGVVPSVQTRARYSTDGAYAGSTPVSCTFDLTSQANRPAALAKLKAAMTPPTHDQAEGFLVLLQAATAHRSEGEAGAVVALTLYASGLRQYPADVARRACERLARGKPGGGTNWFPTYAELMDECDALIATRRLAIASLEKLEAPRLTREKERLTPEERRAFTRAALDQLDAERPTEQPLKSSRPFYVPPTDEAGLSPQMRALMAGRAS